MPPDRGFSLCFIIIVIIFFIWVCIWCWSHIVHASILERSLVSLGSWPVTAPIMAHWLHPVLSCFDNGSGFSIVPLDYKRTSVLDVFGGQLYVRAVSWEIAALVPDGPLYAYVRLELRSRFLPKVWFCHLTVAKFLWPTYWCLTSLSADRQIALTILGDDLIRLLDWLPISRPPSLCTPSGSLWHPRIHRSWPKDAILLNFLHPLHQTLHNMRSALARALPPAKILERAAFHISFDGVVEFRNAEPDSGFLSWSLEELVCVFEVNRRSGVYWDGSLRGCSGRSL